MELTLTTPSLLFPAISLLLLAYTNRFLALATLIRALDASYQKSRDHRLPGQIQNLSRRLRLIRDMQFCGVLSLLFCTLCMFLLFFKMVNGAEIIFSVALLLMIVSLGLSAEEIRISTRALDLQLKNVEETENQKSDGERGT